MRRAARRPARRRRKGSVHGAMSMCADRDDGAAARVTAAPPARGRTPACARCSRGKRGGARRCPSRAGYAGDLEQQHASSAAARRCSTRRPAARRQRDQEQAPPDARLAEVVRDAGSSATALGPSPGRRFAGSALKRAICRSPIASKTMPNAASAAPATSSTPSGRCAGDADRGAASRQATRAPPAARTPGRGSSTRSRGSLRSRIAR